MTENLAHQLAISAVLIGATTFVHGLFVASAAAIFRTAAREARGLFRFVRDSFSLVLLAIWLTCAHALEIALWGGLFMHYELFSDWETSLYFAGSSFTTLGFGDVLLPPEWRLLSSAAAANGLILFGLSAAFLFDVAGRLRLAGRGDA